MCILLCTRDVPGYKLVVGSNRDEYFERPTVPAQWLDQVLMPVDMARREHGTWIGISSKGRIAILLNVREKTGKTEAGVISRGKITADFLRSELSPLLWVKDIRRRCNDFRDMDGFSLVFGELKTGEIYTMSNRRHGVDMVFNDRLGGAAVFGLSNSLIDAPWPKVLHGMKMMEETTAGRKFSEEDLIASVFSVMSDRNPEIHEGEGMSKHMDLKIRETVFVPRLVNDLMDPPPQDKQTYGTRTQTVILVHDDGHVVYVERNVALDSVTKFSFILE